LSTSLVARCDIHEESYLTRVPTQDATRKPNYCDILSRGAVHNLLCLNHYWKESIEECPQKRARGRTDRHISGLIPVLFTEFDHEIAALKGVMGNDNAIERALLFVKASLAKRLSSESVLGHSVNEYSRSCSDSRSKSDKSFPF
jgi:hypothetical protein